MGISQHAEQKEQQLAEPEAFWDKVFSSFCKQFLTLLLHGHCTGKRTGVCRRERIPSLEELRHRASLRSSWPATGQLSSGEQRLEDQLQQWLKTQEHLQIKFPFPSTFLRLWCPEPVMKASATASSQNGRTTAAVRGNRHLFDPTWSTWEVWSQVQGKRRLPLGSIFLHCWMWWTFELPDLRARGSLQKIFLLLLKITLFSDAWCTLGNVLINHENELLKVQKEWYCVKIKGSILQEDITIHNVYVSNNRVSWYMKKKTDRIGRRSR